MESLPPKSQISSERSQIELERKPSCIFGADDFAKILSVPYQQDMMKKQVFRIENSAQKSPEKKIEKKKRERRKNKSFVNSTVFPVAPFFPIKESTSIGLLSYQERKAKIEKYLEKKKKRNFVKKVSYLCRKAVAEKRVRLKGRFTRRAVMEDHGENLQEEFLEKSNIIPTKKILKRNSNQKKRIGGENIIKERKRKRKEIKLENTDNVPNIIWDPIFSITRKDNEV